MISDFENWIELVDIETGKQLFRHHFLDYCLNAIIFSPKNENSFIFQLFLFILMFRFDNFCRLMKNFNNVMVQLSTRPMISKLSYTFSAEPHCYLQTIFQFSLDV